MQQKLPYDEIISYEKFETWSEFVSKILTVTPVNREVFYRGQADARWKLIPYPFRNDNDDGDFERTNYILKKVIEDFHDSVLGIDPNIPAKADEHELWMYGRHYGLNTPLLDWSYSPYIAAFFAFSQYLKLYCEEKKNIDYVAIFEMSSHFDNDGRFVINYNEWYPANEFKFINKKVEPQIALGLRLLKDRKQYYIRQKAQRGIFTVLLNEHVDLIGYLKTIYPSDKKLEMIRVYLINAKEVNQCLASLSHMNIHFASLYPDAEGAAKHANLNFEIQSEAKLEVIRKVFDNKDFLGSIISKIKEDLKKGNNQNQ